jgi:chitin disaccharide deacetylase
MQVRYLLSFIVVLVTFQRQAVSVPVQSGSSDDRDHSKHARFLVIEAEDLGMAHSIDKASFNALEKGWATAAGVLVPGPWFPEVARWSINHPKADLGVRLDLNSDWSSYRWRPVSSLQNGSGLADSGGYLPSSQLAVALRATESEVETEERAQIELAKKAGLPITHLDNHMRTLIATPAMFQTYWRMGQQYDLPIVLPRDLVRERGSTAGTEGKQKFGGIEIDLSKVLIDRELEIMPGLSQKDWLGAYEATLKSLPPGFYLLSVHLGFDDDELEAMTWDHPNWGARWRQNDYNVISSPEFHDFLEKQGFILVGWRDLQKYVKSR